MAAKLLHTPVGELNWVFITGQGKENFNKDGYSYTADLVLNTDSLECEGLKEEITEAFKAEFGSKSKAKSTGFRDNDNNTTTFVFKTGAAFKDGTPQVITTFNAEGTKFDIDDVKIGNGSKGRIFYNIGTYTFGASKGVSLYLKALQLSELEEYNTLDSTTDSIDGSFSHTSEGTEPIQVEGI